MKAVPLIVKFPHVCNFCKGEVQHRKPSVRSLCFSTTKFAIFNFKSETDKQPYYERTLIFTLLASCNRLRNVFHFFSHMERINESLPPLPLVCLIDKCMRPYPNQSCIFKTKMYINFNLDYWEVFISSTASKQILFHKALILQ